MENKNYINKEQDRRLIKIERHIEIINSEIGEVKTQITEIRQDVCWLKRFFWIVATASISGLIGSIINLISNFFYQAHL